MAASEANLKYLSGLLGAQTISYDKVNQLRHVRFLQDKAHVLELMQRHAAILRPKFEAVLAALRGIAPLNIASWTEPKGGYFVSCDAMPGTAKRTLALCAEAGVTMTPAGATYPAGTTPPTATSASRRASRPWRSWSRPCRSSALPCAWLHWKSWGSDSGSTCFPSFIIFHSDAEGFSCWTPLHSGSC